MHSWTRAGLTFAAALFAAPALAGGEVEIFDLPPGAHPHDAAPAPGGKVWYTAQAQGALGILDPSTGAVEQVPLGPGSAPHGVIAGPDGKAWITDGGQNAIVSFDPGSRQVSVFPLPEEQGYANLNTAAFDGAGVLWFTGQSGIYGRLDPASGEMQVFDVPKGRGPYGIAATPDGEIYFASLAGSYLGRIDAKTGEASVIEPPTPRQGARRVWSDAGGNLWVSEWNAGQVSRYTPATGAWRSWRLPGDSPQAYAVYVDDEDMVWLSDFGANAVVRFDPKTETFTSFPGSAPGADVRQILGRPGEVFAPESGTDRLMLIRSDGE
jgi:virginiamycin B lyase